MYTIQDLPIPKAHFRTNQKYPWHMDVGQSFILPAEAKTLKHTRVMCFNQSKNGLKFRCVRLPDGSIQVWREA